jgi:hypothetical protein
VKVVVGAVEGDADHGRFGRRQPDGHLELHAQRTVHKGVQLQKV